MTVNETLAAMIRNWPTLYASRLDALSRCFTDTGGEVVDGRYVPESIDTDGDHHIPYDDEEKAVAECHSDIYQKTNPAMAVAIEARARLRVRRMNAKISFIIENADLIAAEDDSKFSYPPSLSHYQLNRIRFDLLNDEWKAAMAEFFHAIIRFEAEQIDRMYYNVATEYRQRYHDSLRTAKEAAQEGLLRLGIGAPDEDAARKTVIAKLRAEAEKLGFKLEKIDPENPFA